MVTTIYCYIADCSTFLLINHNAQRVDLDKLSFIIGGFESDVIFPDTILPMEEINIRDLSGNTFVGNNADWIRIINELPQDTLSFYFFDFSVIKNEGWEKVKDDYLILGRYDLSEADLRKLGFTVPFPPSAEMSTMKMFPEFEEIFLEP